ncbi:unnamed protein product [marine sediment metagenome]|uniref:Uncharacterized protein n=1 Tax=marine sediment metagenome TaxID=412755 RepID=X0Z1X0_9ZZZZ
MIFNEKLRQTGENISMGFKMSYPEKVGGLKGEYWVKLYDRQGHLLAERHNNNIIVNTASVLIARLLKDNSEPSGGITYLAMGTGGVGWDLQNPPQPTTSQTILENEIARKAFSTEDVTFIDPDTGNPTIVPTNVVDFTATFAETEAVGPLVEMGLFGGDATDLLDSGTEVNYRTFPVINKTNSMTLTIIFRITA